MNTCKVEKIIKWFTDEHGEWIQNKKLVSWAAKLGIKLNLDRRLEDDQLFHLFVLAVLWNNKPTFPAKIGEQVYLKIRHNYTLKNFIEAKHNNNLADTLRNIARSTIANKHVFNLLMYIANGRVNEEKVWAKIKQSLNFPVVGNKEDDISRLRWLYGIFNPRRYKGESYLTVKTFLIFREIRIQFRDTGKYQYHPIICCIPDNNVRNALKTLKLLVKTGNGIDGLISVSKIVAEHFCKDIYELYDLPLFLWYKEKIRSHSLNEKVGQARQIRDAHAGICPLCGSPVVWRRAERTCELYRGCTNFKGGCRWNDRSY